MKRGQQKDVTPCEKQSKFAKKIGLKSLYLKREDLHPYGSHKGRSIPHMVDFYANKGVCSFAISSSGNAALAAALYIGQNGARNSDFGAKMTLDIFVGQNANIHKIDRLKALESSGIKVIMKERPVQALMMAEQDGATSLRQSTNDVALVGYEILAKEIADTIERETGKREGAVFMGTSSGTTAQALAKYFVENNLPISMHIVQTTSCHPLADAFGLSDLPDEKSIADAIVDQVAHRKAVLIPLIEKTGGKGWCVTNEEIEIAQTLVAENCDLELSTNGVLGIAGAMQANIVGHEFTGVVVCIVGGE